MGRRRAPGMLGNVGGGAALLVRNTVKHRELTIPNLGVAEATAVLLTLGANRVVYWRE